MRMWMCACEKLQLENIAEREREREREARKTERKEGKIGRVEAKKGTK